MRYLLLLLPLLFSTPAFCSYINVPGGGDPTIGGNVIGGLDKSILFVNPVGVLDQDNPNFIYDVVTDKLTTPELQVSNLGLGVCHADANGDLTSSLIVDADVDAAAAIAGTKIDPDFGAQNVETTGTGSSFGGMTVTNLGLGLVHSDAGGALTSSLLVDADVSATAAIDATKIHDQSVDNTEYGYLDGVTSAIQTQIDGKADTDLNNLSSPTDVNQDLDPDAGGTRDLGSLAEYWQEGWTFNHYSNFLRSLTGGNILRFELASGLMKDSSGNNVVALDQYLIQDGSNSTSVDWGNRQLVSGATVKWDWSGTDLSANTRKITDVSNPTNPQDVVTLDYYDNNIPVSGATIELDNLGTTAINVDMVPDTAETWDLGSSLLPWANIHAQKIYDNAGELKYDIRTGDFYSSNGPGSESLNTVGRDLTNTAGTDVLRWDTATVQMTSAAVADLTSGRIVLAGADGELTDSSSITYSGSEITANTFNGNIDTGNIQAESSGGILIESDTGTDIVTLGASSGSSAQWLGTQTYAASTRWIESGGGTDTVGLAAPSAIAGSFILTLPNTNGNDGEILAVDGSGNLDWVVNNGPPVESVFSATTFEPTAASVQIWTFSNGSTPLVLASIGTTNITDQGLVEITGVSDTGTLTVNHSDTLDGIILNGPAVLGRYGKLVLRYDLSFRRYIEVSRNGL